MPEANEDQEPSMEEILASIRRIISEDTPQEDPEAPAATKEEKHEEVLELTDPVEDEPPPAIAPIPEESPAPAPVYTTPVLSHDDGAPPLTSSLVSEETALASVASFSAVATEARRRLPREQQMGDGSASLEGIVRDMLRPMLKDWLDTHLPELVSRLVAEEIERLASRAK